MLINDCYDSVDFVELQMKPLTASEGSSVYFSSDQGNNFSDYIWGRQLCKKSVDVVYCFSINVL